MNYANINLDHFIYPASIYKVFVAAEIVRQIDVGERNFDDIVEITSQNEDSTRYFL